MQGTQVGTIRIEGELGRGGMGVVYRGIDTRLDREVAVKALPEDLAADPDRLARFEREARTLAQLNHPNVAGIHGVEEHEGGRYLVLEFVPGETLADRLDRGPIPPEEAVELALQIAAGVDAAHEAGVIHRDLKPQNVIVTPEGQAKVLDFGLARTDETGTSSSSSMSQNPTLTSPAMASPTSPGVILGTAAYMSPEQARGRKVDRRTDIWSFGVVLYEMLTGLSPFIGETVTDSIGAVLHKDPDLALLPADTPSGVRRALKRCLERDRNQRFRDLSDVAIELRDFTPASEGAGQRSLAPLAIAIVALLVAAASVTWAILNPADQPAAAQPPLTFSVDLLPDAEFNGLTVSRPFSISPDGSTLVVAAEVEGEDGLWIRSLDRDDAIYLSGTAGAAHPVFSPDARWIAYFNSSGLWKISAAGGSPQKLADGVGSAARGVAWVGNDRLVYAPTTTSPIMIVGANGGSPSELTDLSDPIAQREFRSHRWPVVTPDNRWVVFAGQLPGESFFESSIYAASLEDGEMVLLVQGGGAFPIVLADGTIVHLSEGTVYDSAIDWSVPAAVAPPRPVLYGVVNAALNGSASIDISDNGTAIYTRGDIIGVQAARLGWYDIPTGQITYAFDETLVADAPAISDDGRFIALQTATASSGGDLLVYEHGRGIMRRLPTGGGFLPIWAPDNQRIAYSTSDNQVTSRIYTVDISGEQQPVPITEGGIREQFPNDWSRDGSRLIYMQWTDGQSWDLNMLVWDDPDSEPRIETALATPSNESQARFSPDGRWIAYESSISGQGEVYIRRLEGAPERAQISIDGGRLPLWGPEGRTIYFQTERDPIAGPGEIRVMRVDLTEAESGALLPSVPVEVGPVDLSTAPGPYPTMDIQSDGSRLIFMAPPSDGRTVRSNQTYLMTGWFDRER